MARHTKHKLTEEDIRSQINAHLGARPLKSREWSLLIDKRYIYEIQHDGVSITEALEYIREIRWAQESPDEPEQNRDTKMLSKEEAKRRPDRSFALSLLLYEEASKDDELRAFRTEVLANTLL